MDLRMDLDGFMGESALMSDSDTRGVRSWVYGIIPRNERARIADLTAFDAGDTMIRYNCLDAAMGLTKPADSRRGRGTQPGELSDPPRSKPREQRWTCPILESLVESDMSGVSVRAMNPGDLPTSCDGRIVSRWTTADDASEGGDFHVLMLAQHVLFRLNSRMYGEFGGEDGRVTGGDIGRVLKARGVRVYVHGSKTAIGDDDTIRRNSIVLATNVWVYVHKRGTSTPLLFRDADNNVIKAVRGGSRPSGNMVYEPRAGRSGLNYTKHCATVCMRGGDRDIERAL
jgi:hypothetical protein